MGLSRLPESLVMRRWTVCAKAAEGSGADDGYRHAPPDLVALHSILYNASMELVSMGRESRQAFEVALSFVAKAKEAISSMSVVHPSLVQPPPCSERSDPIRERDEADQLKGVVAPPHVWSRGRPRQSRFKSPVESPGAHKRKRPFARENVDGIDLHQLAVGPTGPLTSRPDRGPSPRRGWWAPSHNAINSRWGPRLKTRGSLEPPHLTEKP